MRETGFEALLIDLGVPGRTLRHLPACRGATVLEFTVSGTSGVHGAGCRNGGRSLAHGIFDHLEEIGKKLRKLHPSSSPSANCRSFRQLQAREPANEILSMPAERIENPAALESWATGLWTHDRDL
jgi:hypothetical protein